MQFIKPSSIFLASLLRIGSLYSNDLTNWKEALLAQSKTDSSDSADIKPEKEEYNFTYWDIHPWHAGGQFLRVGKADCTNTDGRIYYRKTNVFTQILLPLNYDNFFIPRFEFNYVTFDWNKNLNFNEKHFYYLQFSLAYYTTALDKWKWIARFDYNIQTDHLSQAGKYSLYSGLLWGAYQIHRKWHYHVGALGYGGLEGQTMFPIIGFDYSPNKTWFFQALFPINYSIEYKQDRWTFAAKIRPVKERLRSGSREPVPRSIFNYSAFGSELNVKYDIPFRLTLEGYGGVNYGGKFYIKDGHGHNATYVKFGLAPYYGASLDFGF
jgi:hypothetical protein